MISGEIRGSGDIPLLGFNQFLRMKVSDCSAEDQFMVIGRKVIEEKAYDPLSCSCGNGYCGEGESRASCPADCATLMRIETFHALGPLAVYMMVLLTYAGAAGFFAVKFLSKRLVYPLKFYVLVVLSFTVATIHYISFGEFLPLAYISTAFAFVYMTALEVWAQSAEYNASVGIKGSLMSIRKSAREMDAIARSSGRALDLMKRMGIAVPKRAIGGLRRWVMRRRNGMAKMMRKRGKEFMERSNRMIGQIDVKKLDRELEEIKRKMRRIK
jgi:hypothetical protein